MSELLRMILWRRRVDSSHPPPLSPSSVITMKLSADLTTIESVFPKDASTGDLKVIIRTRREIHRDKPSVEEERRRDVLGFISCQLAVLSFCRRHSRNYSRQREADGLELWNAVD